MDPALKWIIGIDASLAGATCLQRTKKLIINCSLAEPEPPWAKLWWLEPELEPPWAKLWWLKPEPEPPWAELCWLEPVPQLQLRLLFLTLKILFKEIFKIWLIISYWFRVNQKRFGSPLSWNLYFVSGHFYF